MRGGNVECVDEAAQVGRQFKGRAAACLHSFRIAASAAGGIARAGGTLGAAMIVKPRKGPKLSKAELSARLSRLADREDEDEDEEAGMSVAAKLRARFG